jgi:hypothetical protein
LTQPVWSIPAASDVNAIAFGTNYILLSAQAGGVVVSATDGSTAATLPSGLFGKSNGQLQVTDGLAEQDNTVIELD